MPENEPVDLKAVIKSMPDAELPQFTEWLITERYRIQADKVGVKMPVGDFMPADGRKIRSVWDEEGSVVPSHTDPQEVEKRLAQVGLFGGNDGAVTFVGPDGRYWIGFESDENMQALEDAGYKNGAQYGVVSVNNIMNAGYKFKDPKLQEQWEQREAKAYAEQQAKSLIPPEKREEVAKIVEQIRTICEHRRTQILAYSFESYYFKDVWGEDVKKSNDVEQLRALQRQLSTVLNLPEDRSFQMAETVKHLSLYIPHLFSRFLSPLYAYLTENQKRDTLEEAIKLFQRIYSTAPSKLQETIEKATNAFAAGDQRLFDQYQDKLPRLEIEAAGMSYHHFNSLFQIYNEAFLDLKVRLDNPSSRLEDIAKAFAERNHAFIDLKHYECEMFQKASDYRETLAKKSGIKITNPGQYNSIDAFILEEIPQPSSREPWQMTKEEFLANPPKGTKYDPEMKSPQPQPEDKEKTILLIGDNFFSEPEESRHHFWNLSRGHQLRQEMSDEILDMARQGIFGPNPYEETLGEPPVFWSSSTPDANFVATYVRLVEDPSWLKANFPQAYDIIARRAIEQGHTLPAEVLADYPTLLTDKTGP